MLEPSRSEQLRFWLLGLRLPAPCRPWVAQQITAPGYARRRALRGGAVPLVAVALPQVLLAAVNRQPWHLLVAGGVLLGLALSWATARRGLGQAERRRLLAYHGVDEHGRVVRPVSAWTASPLGAAGTAVLALQVGVLAVGTAVVADARWGSDRCRSVPAEAVTAVQEVLGRPAPSGTASSLVGEGATLVHPRRVQSGLDGVSYLAASIRTDRLPVPLGPAVWRVLEPGGALPVPELEVDAADLLAKEATPSLGSSFSSGVEPLLEKARACSRAAG